MQRGGRSRTTTITATLALAIGALGAVIAPGASPAPAAGSGGTTTACDPLVPSSCTLRELADAVGLRIGATAEAAETTDPDYAATLDREFNAITPENAMKWYTIRPTRTAWNFGPADTVMDWADEHGMEVRGHTLVWSQDTYTPNWVKAITNATELRNEMYSQISTVMGRYAGRIHRWDVVNEPLATLGSDPSTSVFWRVLGSDWIADAFEHAHSVDPTAELWLNEFGSDWVEGKHAALLALVTDLVDAGVPIHGVGIQTHRTPYHTIDQATFAGQLQDFVDLGLEVAITELDVPVLPTNANALTEQAREYGTILDACLSVTGCNEITMWGVTDAYTWLDTAGIWPTPTRPLLFDNAYAPKPAYTALRTNLATAAACGRIGIAPAASVEGSSGRTRSLEFVITLSRPATRDITVQYRVVPGSAGSADIYDNGSVRTVRFRAVNGRTPTRQYVRVKLRDDATVEDDEVFAVMLSHPTGGYRLAAPGAFGTIIDDDPAGATAVRIGDGGGWEGLAGASPRSRNAARVWVSLNRPLATTATVQVTVTPLTASTTDFVPRAPFTLTFRPGQVELPVSLAIVPDLVAEGTETVRLTLSAPTGGLALGRSVGTVSVYDNDCDG